MQFRLRVRTFLPDAITVDTRKYPILGMLIDTNVKFYMRPLYVIIEAALLLSTWLNTAVATQ